MSGTDDDWLSISRSIMAATMMTLDIYLIQHQINGYLKFQNSMLESD